MSITSPDDRISVYSPVVPTTDFPAVFPVFDNTDVAVFVDGAERLDFTVTASYVEGISNDAKAVFAVGITGDVKVIGNRTPRRTARFNSGPLPTRDQNLALDTLEAESQENRRDVNRAVKSAFGQPSYEIVASLADGDTLMKSGGFLVKGPNADDIVVAEEYAEQAQTASEAAAASAIAAIGAVNTGYLFDTKVEAEAVAIPLVLDLMQTAGRQVVGDGGKALFVSVPDVDYLGGEIARNGAFSSDQLWNLGVGWTISGGVATKTGVNNSSILQAFVFETGAVYEVTYTISGYSGAGTFRVQFQGGTLVNGTARSANGTYTQRLTAAAGNNYYDIVAIGAGGNIDNFSIRKVQRSGQVITNPGVLQRRWENREDTITPAMFADAADMLEFTRAQIQVPKADYEFGRSIITRPNLVMRMEPGAVFRPTFEPTDLGRGAQLVRLSPGADINYLHLDLVAGINTIRTGVEIGDNSQLGMFKATSADLNNNRTEQGSTDLISGALLIRGTGIRIGVISLNRFDRGWSVIDSQDVVIQHVRNLETLMGGYVHGTRDLHILSGYTTGPADPTTPNFFSNPRGIMTPGLNSLCLAGCADSSFSNWSSYDMLEHALRVGGIADGTTVPNHRLAFNNVKSYRPYGCGFKLDDDNAFNIKYITLNGLYTEDVGRGNWFGTPGYSNWASNNGTDYINTPLVDNDGNKAALAIRNSQYVTFSDFMNRKNAQSESGFIGCWVERSNNVQGANIDTEKSRTTGVSIQSGSGTSPERIELRGVASRENAGDGIVLNAAPSTDPWRGVHVTDIVSQNNVGAGVRVTNSSAGLSPYTTIKSRISGFASGNGGGDVVITAQVAADTDFVNSVAA